MAPQNARAASRMGGMVGQAKGAGCGQCIPEIANFTSSIGDGVSANPEGSALLAQPCAPFKATMIRQASSKIGIVVGPSPGAAMGGTPTTWRIEISFRDGCQIKEEALDGTDLGFAVLGEESSSAVCQEEKVEVSGVLAQDKSRVGPFAREENVEVSGVGQVGQGKSDVLAGTMP